MNRESGVTEASITISNLSKRYPGGQKLALDSLNLSVKPGEVYGFLGPNGAGKSTTIRLLMNFIEPTAGQAKILGYDAVEDSVTIKQNVGYLAGDSALYPAMTGKQFLTYMHQLQPATSIKYMNELSRRMKAQLDKKIGELSRGNRQKIGIIQAFMHRPDVLILDEPSSGLDPLMQEELYKLIGEARLRGSSVFMSSHILSEVQKVCDRIGIIREGKLVSEEIIADMEAEAAQTFDITFSGKVPLNELKKIPGATVENSDGQNVTIHIKGNLSPLFGVLAKSDVRKIDARGLDLEEMFLRFYQDDGGKQ
jgi:ABC-2 type transport system ATP-binding protein